MVTAASTVVGRLTVDEQRAMVSQVRKVMEAAPLIKPTAGGLPMSVRVTNAGPWGWVADGQGYRYAHRHPVTGKPWPLIPTEWKILADRYAGLHDWDCAHIVWYAPDAKLGWHRDKTEHDRTGPVVTFSLGDPAVWCVREEEGAEETRALLTSGAVVLLHGDSRDVLHRIARINASDENDMFNPSPLPKPGRVAVSLRAGAGPRS